MTAVSSSPNTKAQTIKDQSQNMASSPIHVASASSPQIHNQAIPTHPIFAATMSQNTPQQNHHHLQILGDHPASPVQPTFMELGADAFMPERPAPTLYLGDDYQEYQEPIYDNAFMPYSSPEGSSEYMYAKLRTSSSSSSFPQDQYAAGVAAASMGSYMSMTRSIPLPQLSDDNMAFGYLSGQASLNQATSSHIMYDDDYYNAAQHHLYSQAHMNHHHSYSTSSLSSISEDSSSMSPRSPFSSNSSLSSSCNSIASSYPLVRTLSESPVPVTSNNSASLAASGLNPDGTPIIRPTPKRSRGRRVSCNPDNSGCKVFTCRFEDCGKIFKRSEHLKRHVRSIHTMEKPFECPIQNCPKRFSRSDNLNQHIRIHRHNGRGEKVKNFPAFTPFMQNYPTELMSLS
ncbi:hypothetical protein BGZ74_001478 [Mortierella antarctica]|nr:hypothetical protein BGZ74_001478 [Mortierella antarctica]